MKMFKHLMVVALALFAFNALAENKIWVDNFEMKPNETKELQLKAIGDQSIGGIQVRIKPVTGMTFAKIKGKYGVQYDNDEDEIYPEWLIFGCSVLTKNDAADEYDSTGDLTFLAAKNTGDELVGNKEHIFMTFKVQTDDTFTGTEKMILHNMAMSTLAGTSVPIAKVREVATEVVETIATEKAVKGVKYYNLLGVESAEPFAGVNVVVTEFEDGSKTAAKVVK